MRDFLRALALLAALHAGATGERASAAAPSDLCRIAAIEAADRHGVPRQLMLAITLVETRRRVAGRTGPWPWTLNIHGKGKWFDARADALAHARAAIAAGRQSVDIGCFQINYRWHGHNFGSLEAMMAPTRAADYAAAWLAELYGETGDWLRAAGHYHSRTPQHGQRYRRLVAAALSELSDEPRRLAEAPRLTRPSAISTPGTRNSPTAPGTRPRPDREMPIIGYTAPAPGAVRLTVLLRPSAPLIGGGQE